jgi:hypothetical protein
MLAFLPIEFWLLMLAFGFLIGTLLVALVLGARRRRDPKYQPPPVRFTPHWQLMLMLGAATAVVVLSILIPLVTGFPSAWRSR